VPAKDFINIQLNQLPTKNLKYILTNALGQIIEQDELDALKLNHQISLKQINSSTIFLSVIVDDKYYLSKKISTIN
jgi:hypothetical protein